MDDKGKLYKDNKKKANKYNMFIYSPSHGDRAPHNVRANKSIIRFEYHIKRFVAPVAAFPMN